MKPKTQNWLDLADGDIRVAGYLFDKKEYLHYLFFCQQAIEKALKAVYYEKNSKTPPRKHNLMSLAEAAAVLSELDEPRKDLFATLSQYYIESRYTEDRKELAKNCTKASTKKLLGQTGDVFE